MSRLPVAGSRSEEHTSELQSRENLVCRLLLEKKMTNKYAFLQITRRRFLNEWEAFKKVISRRNILIFIFIAPTTTNIYTLSLHDALPLLSTSANSRMP